MLRDFSPDRPGSTNTALTVDAGHFNFEFELANYSRLTPETGSAISQFNYPNLNLRVGVTSRFEVDAAWVSQVSQQVNNQMTTGFGDLNLRIKWNMLGNDGGSMAWALMPGVKVPLNTKEIGNNKLEPYFMFPFTFNLPGDWGFSIMPEIDLRKNASNDSYHFEFNSPYNFGHHLFGPLDGFIEYVTHSSNDIGAGWTSYLGFGVSAKVGGEMQIDVGYNAGLNSSTPQVNPYVGFSMRY